jgi:DNA-binding transcriptional MerR regulator
MPDKTAVASSPTNEPRYRIGEVARRTGLSLRAIRLYEDKGLLEPLERSASGYRLYREADVHRLEHIRALRRFGFDLAAMAPLFAQAPLDEDWIAPFLARIEEELAALRAMQDRLRLLQHLPMAQRTDPAAMRTAMVTLCHCEAWFTPEELLALHAPVEQKETSASRDEPSSTDPSTTPIKDPMARWMELRQALEHCHQAGMSPEDSSASHLVEEIERLVLEALPVADAERAEALERFWSLLASDPSVRIEHGLDEDLWTYLCRIRRLSDAGLINVSYV